MKNRKNINFEEITLRLKVSSRGGGIEVDLTSLGWDGVGMTAYQNYLGGGMLGAVATDCIISDWYDNKDLSEIADQLREYYHNLTNPDEDSWEGSSYEENQKRSASAY